jgi:hypothetical protein
LDIIAHGLCTAAVGVGARRRSHQRLRLWWAIFFGVLPDFVSFSIPACLRVWWFLTGASASLLPTPDGPHFEWVWTLYNSAHSLVVFALVFAGLWLLRGRPVVETLGWALHILLDVFTHRGMFAIQFLWPVSAIRLDGIPWETPWFLAATYGSLVTAWVLLFCRRMSQSRGGQRGRTPRGHRAGARPG